MFEELIKNAPKFEPYMRYDSDSDSFKILVKNCSIIEEEILINGISRNITILYEAHGEYGTRRQVGLRVDNLTGILGFSKELLSSISTEKLLDSLYKTPFLFEEEKELIRMAARSLVSRKPFLFTY